MSLKTLKLKTAYNTSTDDIIQDFFVPILSQALKYDRGVGFFSAAWIRLACQGLTDFASNGGKARWVTSPILAKDDWQSLINGERARRSYTLLKILENNISDLRVSLEQDTLTALSWLVADGVLDFKLALPRNKLHGGEFHDKFGIFTDANGNQISFNGSYNDSLQGTRNYESIKVFWSWESAYTHWVQDDSARFENLWLNRDKNVEVFDLPKAAIEQIIRLRPPTATRPYVVSENNQDIDDLPSIGDTNVGWNGDIALPDNIQLRPYQVEAIDSWFQAECNGIFEMATGTGKTITALSAIARLINQEKHVLVLVICPYTHLVEQWTNEALAFGFRPIQAVESKAKWQNELAEELRRFKRDSRKVVTIIGTNSALQRGLLDEMLSPYWDRTVFVSDEVHYTGSPGMISRLPLKAPWRLGLSATPIRHYDEDGTDIIFSYFGEVVYELPLQSAIGEFLTPYVYYPILVELTDEEFDEYLALTRQLRKLVRGPDEPMSDAAKMIAIKRARVTNNSIAKAEWLDGHIDTYAPIQYTLFYVGDKLFSDVKKLLGVDKRIKVHEFTQRQNIRERTDILKRFEQGNLQGLVAMRCLDEGVDVPPTRTAYFLASSGNPREFVQRRGRVLRKSPGKEAATLYDLISIPPMSYIDMGRDNPEFEAVRSAVKREYKRIKEFASLANNHYQALESLYEVLDKLEMLDT